jgi:ferric-dicitrate binding protein FerR (iron transport regulator)
MDESQRDLWERFIRNECSTAEIEQLLAQFNDAANEADLRALIDVELHKEVTDINPALPDLEQKEADIYATLRPFIREKRKSAFWPRIAAAASIALLLGVGGYFALHKKRAPIQLVQNQQTDITPGQNRATLTLANGQKIILAKGLKGQLAIQKGTVIRAGDNGVTYNAKNKEEEVSYNTLATAKGEQSPYPLVLADGTKVWLNAASSITFPTAFNGNSREVKITGEAYFEVAHNAAMPFRVSSNAQTVEVLGTHFDIKAYTDESGISTTLLEGKVKVSKDNQFATLAPGQQSFIPFKGNSISVKNANTEIAMAWRNGLFKYNLADIKTVMRDFARWYDVDIEYEGQIPNKTFTGELYRDINASEALQILSLTKVHFKIDGKKIIVTPN